MQKFTLALLLGLLLNATLGRAQTTYQTVGIIGSATAAGWVASTPMNLPNPADPHSWSITLSLVQGEVKFRANDTWLFNWGAAAFPTGQGVSGGPNIPIPAAGIYTVQFHDLSGGYDFIRQPTTATKAGGNPLRPLLLPNPATGAVRVGYELPAAGPVAVSVLNLLGQVVRREAAARRGAGPQEQVLPLAGLTPGLYLVQVQAGGHVESARLQID